MTPSEAAIIDITPTETAEVRAVALALPSDARAVKVIDHISRAAANDFFLRCREARKVIATHYDPKIEEWKAAKKLADDNRAKMVAEKTAAEAPIVEAEGIVKKEILRFDAEEEVRLERERREAEEKARKEAEEAALREAAEAEAKGDKEEAAAILDEAVTAPLPIFVPSPPPPPKLAGSAKMENWKFRVDDLKTLVAAVAVGRVPLSAVKADEVAIGQTVRALKGSFAWPGIKTWPEKDIRPTGR